MEKEVDSLTTTWRDRFANTVQIWRVARSYTRHADDSVMLHVIRAGDGYTSNVKLSREQALSLANALIRLAK